MRHALVGALTALCIIGLPAGAAAASTDGVDVGGSVWLDLDGDGTRDDGEPGRNGVQVTLRTEAAIVDAAITRADGTWSLGNVAAGTYSVLVEAPIDHVVTGGTLPGLDAATGTATIEVAGTALPDLGSVGLGSPVSSGPDLATTVVHEDDPADDGRHTWQVGVHNLGPEDADGPLDVRIVLSPAHEAVEASGQGWTCDLAAAIVLCSTDAAAAAGTSLPPLTLTSAPVGDVGASMSVTGTVRLDGVFDAAPLNDEATASPTAGAGDAATDLDGDGTADITDAGAPVEGLLVAGLLAVVVGAATVRTSRRSARRP